MFGKKKKNEYEEAVEESRDEFDVDYNDDEDFEEEGRSAQSRSGRWSRSVLPFFVEQEENDDHDSGVNDNFAGDEREEESMVDGMEWSATV